MNIEAYLKRINYTARLSRLQKLCVRSRSRISWLCLSRI